MNKTEHIAACLISSRNILLGGSTTLNVHDCLEDALGNIDSIKIDTTRELMRLTISKVVDLINDSNYVGAGYVLNLIHNFPLSVEAEKYWDLDYFLSIELPTFLEHFEEIDSARNIIIPIFNWLAAKYKIG